MLIHQAIEADRHFTGTDPGPHRAFHRVMEELKRQDARDERSAKEVGK